MCRKQEFEKICFMITMWKNEATQYWQGSAALWTASFQIWCSLPLGRTSWQRLEGNKKVNQVETEEQEYKAIIRKKKKEKKSEELEKKSEELAAGLPLCYC